MDWLRALIAWLMRTPKPIPAPVPAPTPQPPAPPEPPVAETLLWDTPEHAFHAVRVICDERGLTVDEKNVICACIYQESTFKNAAIGRNRDKDGTISSTDWGIVQVNDYWNIGKGKPFPSVEYVVNNPEACVRWMVSMYKNGKLYLWSSYKFGAYKQWLNPGSPMWKLKTPG